MENNDENLIEENDEVEGVIEELSVNILEALKVGNIDVNIEPLTNAIQLYASRKKFNQNSVNRWKARLSEITAILEAQYKKIQDEIQSLVENDNKIAAYNKVENIK